MFEVDLGCFEVFQGAYVSLIIIPVTFCLEWQLNYPFLTFIVLIPENSYTQVIFRNTSFAFKVVL